MSYSEIEVSSTGLGETVLSDKTKNFFAPDPDDEWFFGESVGAWINRKVGKLMEISNNANHEDSKVNFFISHFSMKYDKNGNLLELSQPTLYRLFSSKDYVIRDERTRKFLEGKIGVYGYKDAEFEVFFKEKIFLSNELRVIKDFSFAISEILNRFKRACKKDSIYSSRGFSINFFQGNIKFFEKVILQEDLGFFLEREDVDGFKKCFLNCFSTLPEFAYTDIEQYITYLRIKVLIFLRRFATRVRSIKIAEDTVYTFYNLPRERGCCSFCVNFEGFRYKHRHPIHNPKLKVEKASETKGGIKDEINRLIETKESIHKPQSLLPCWDENVTDVRRFYMTSDTCKRFGVIRPLMRASFESEFFCCEECFKSFFYEIILPLPYLIEMICIKWSVRQQDIAEHLGIKQSTISRVINKEIKFLDSDIVKDLYTLYAHGA